MLSVCVRPINLLNMKSTICYPAETASLFINIFQLIIYLPKVWLMLYAPILQFRLSYGLLMYELCITGLIGAVCYCCAAAHGAGRRCFRDEGKGSFCTSEHLEEIFDLSCQAGFSSHQTVACF